MTRLFSAELRKVWQNKFFLLALGVLLAANLFLLWFGTGHGNAASPAAYRRMEESLSGMSMKEMGGFLQEEQARAQGLARVETVLQQEAYNGGRKNESLRQAYAEAFERYYDTYSAGNFLRYGETMYQEYFFLETIRSEFEAVNGYEEFLDSIAQKAEKLSSLSIFADSGGYDTENIRATAQAFETMRGTEIYYYPQMGLTTALDFELTDWITVFALVLIATVLVRAERDGGLLALIRSTPAGRLKTACAKLLALAVTLLAVLVGLYGVNLAYCGGLYGLGPLGRTIQSVPQLMRSTWKLTVGEYLGCFLLTKWLAALICGVWVMLAMLLAKRMLTGALGALALLAVNLLLRAFVSPTGPLNVLKYANLVSLLRTNELLGGYRNLYWFNRPVPLLAVECIAAALFMALFLAAFCIAFSRCYFAAAKSRATAFRLRRRAAAFTTPFRQEAYKLLVMQGVALLLALFAGVQIYTALTAQSYQSAEEIYYHYYMKQVEGLPTQQKLDFLVESARRILPGKFTGPDGVVHETNGSNQQEAHAFQKVVSRLQNLGERPRTQLVYETGWLKLFDHGDAQDLPDTLWMALLCALCFSGLFAMERQTGMIQVIGATPLGRRATVRYKLLLALAVCGALTALSLLPRFWTVARDYGLGAWLAPVYSIPAFAKAPEIPLFLMAALLFLGRFAAVCCMACVTLALSQAVGNTFGALFASLVLFVLAPLLSLAGLTGAKWAGVYPLFHVAALFESGNQALGLLHGLVATGVTYLCVQYLLARFGAAERRA